MDIFVLKCDKEELRRNIAGIFSRAKSLMESINKRLFDNWLGNNIKESKRELKIENNIAILSTEEYEKTEEHDELKHYYLRLASLINEEAKTENDHPLVKLRDEENNETVLIKTAAIEFDALRDDNDIPPEIAVWLNRNGIEQNQYNVFILIQSLRYLVQKDFQEWQNIVCVKPNQETLEKLLNEERFLNVYVIEDKFDLDYEMMGWKCEITDFNQTFIKRFLHNLNLGFCCPLFIFNGNKESLRCLHTIRHIKQLLNLNKIENFSGMLKTILLAQDYMYILPKHIIPIIYRLIWQNLQKIRRVSKNLEKTIYLNNANNGLLHLELKFADNFYEIPLIGFDENFNKKTANGNVQKKYALKDIGDTPVIDLNSENNIPEKLSAMIQKLINRGRFPRDINDTFIKICLNGIQISDDPNDQKVGDCVYVKRQNTGEPKKGIIRKIDSFDQELPYYVAFDNEFVWCDKNAIVNEFIPVSRFLKILVLDAKGVVR